MEVNRTVKSGKLNRHINVRYLFVNNLMRMYNIYIHNCTSEEMVFNFLMKPLQGALFQWFWEPITNIVLEWRKPILWPMVSAGEIHLPSSGNTLPVQQERHINHNSEQNGLTTDVNMFVCQATGFCWEM